MEETRHLVNFIEYFIPRKRLPSTPPHSVIFVLKVKLLQQSATDVSVTPLPLIPTLLWQSQIIFTMLSFKLLMEGYHVWYIFKIIKWFFFFFLRKIINCYIKHFKFYIYIFYCKQSLQNCRPPY